VFERYIFIPGAIPLREKLDYPPCKTRCFENHWTCSGVICWVSCFHQSYQHFYRTMLRWLQSIQFSLRSAIQASYSVVCPKCLILNFIGPKSIWSWFLNVAIGLLCFLCRNRFPFTQDSISSRHYSPGITFSSVKPFTGYCFYRFIKYIIHYTLINIFWQLFHIHLLCSILCLIRSDCSWLLY